MNIERFGVRFMHAKGTRYEDEVIWMWPWKRSSRENRFMSIGFNSMFGSLRELDKCWDGYIEACKQ